MEFEPEAPSSTAAPAAEFAKLPPRSPLVLLKETERSLRSKAIDVVGPILPEPIAANLGEASLVADESLEKLAEIDLDEITDQELRPARIQVGLIFVGFGALAMVFLLLYLDTLHPDLTPIEQVRKHWYQYIWFVSLGVAGLFMLGRESMRPPD